MIRKLPLFAATFLSVAWASAAQATNDKNVAAAPTSTVVAVAAAQATPSTKPKPKASKGLCERVGGIFGIAKVVDLFSNAILTNAVLNQNPALAEWNEKEAPTDLPGLKVMRTIWIADMAGCDQVKYFGLPLEQAHDRFDLTAAQFAEVGSEIVKALQAVGVAQADIDELVRIYQSSMGDVVESAEPKAVTPSQ
jgi:hemoglobin